MPPKKKGKTAGSTRAASTPVADEDTMIIDSRENKEDNESYHSLKDPWTDEQETSLFKGIIKWKPAGMHRHFRMISISEYLRNHGYDPTIEQHTSIPGIWEKLSTLYDLKNLDDREDFIPDEDEKSPKFLDFSLPDDSYGKLMFMRGQRGSSDSPSSPSQTAASPSPSPKPTKKRRRGDTIVGKTRASTVEDTDEARTSPAQSTPPPRRTGRSTNKSMGRVRAESSRSRQESKDTVADSVDEGTAEEGTEAGDEEEGTEDGEGTPSSNKKIPKSKADPLATRRGRRKR